MRGSDTLTSKPAESPPLDFSCPSPQTETTEAAHLHTAKSPHPGAFTRCHLPGQEAHQVREGVRQLPTKHTCPRAAPGGTPAFRAGFPTTRGTPATHEGGRPTPHTHCSEGKVREGRIIFSCQRFQSETLATPSSYCQPYPPNLRI